MDTSVIGLIGIVIGVVLSSIFQLLNKYIDYRIVNKNRWIDDKKRTYADFLMSSNTWFRSSLVEAQKIIATDAGKKLILERITESRAELNSKLANISIIAKPKVAKESEEFNEWMQNTIIDAGQQIISAEDAKEKVTVFLTKRTILTQKFREDLS